MMKVDISEVHIKAEFTDKPTALQSDLWQYHNARTKLAVQIKTLQKLNFQFLPISHFFKFINKPSTQEKTFNIYS